jgi:gamma-glutamyl:cysteine ligase YbdK (ATP-grasp superfamily)
LDRALESVSLQDLELAATVITHDDRNDGRYLQPAPGTVEVRVMDAQSRVRDVTPVVALIQSLARLELECEPSSVVPSAELPPSTASSRLETGWTPG